MQPANGLSLDCVADTGEGAEVDGLDLRFRLKTLVLMLR